MVKRAENRPTRASSSCMVGFTAPRGPTRSDRDRFRHATPIPGEYGRTVLWRSCRKAVMPLTLRPPLSATARQRRDRRHGSPPKMSGCCEEPSSRAWLVWSSSSRISCGRRSSAAFPAMRKDTRQSDAHVPEPLTGSHVGGLRARRVPREAARPHALHEDRQRITCILHRRRPEHARRHEREVRGGGHRSADHAA